MARGFVAALAVVLAGLAVPAVAAEPAPIELKAAGPWDLDYAEPVCSLRRRFTDGTGETIIEFQKRSIGPVFGQVRIASKVFTARRDKVKLRFGPGDVGEWEYPVIVGNTLDKRVAMVIPSVALSKDWFDLKQGAYRSGDEIIPSAERAAADIAAMRDMTITQGKQAVHVPLGAMSAAIGELDKCVIAKHAALAAKMGLPVADGSPPKPARLDAEKDARRRGNFISGEFSHDVNKLFLTMAVVVGADGKPESCKVIEVEGGRATDGLCGFLFRVTAFEPARMRDGTAVRGLWVAESGLYSGQF